MADLIFFFQRQPTLTSDEFRQHYLTTHAPLALRLTTSLERYVVNLAHPRHIDDALLTEPHDAMTAAHVADADAFFDTTRSFATADDAATLMADHHSFIASMDAYEVAVSGTRPDAPSAVKVVARMTNPVDASLVSVREGVDAAVVSNVTRSLTPDAPPLAAVVEAWGASDDAVRAVLVALDPHAIVLPVDEHVFR